MHIYLQQRDPAAGAQPDSEHPGGSDSGAQGAQRGWAFVSGTETSRFSSLACHFIAFSHVTLIN